MSRIAISITIPYDASLGKNRALRYGNKNVRKDSATKANQEGIVWRIRGQMNEKNITFEKQKTFVSIHVFRPKDPADGERRDIDPVNFQPFCLDAVSEAISVDDTWFESCVTWQICEEPFISILVEQGGLVDVRYPHHEGIDVNTDLYERVEDVIVPKGRE